MVEASNLTTFKLESPDNVNVFVRKWTPTNQTPKAVILVVHGAAEHGQRYDRLAKLLNNSGYVVYAPDHRGHGMTAGSLDKAGWAGSDGWNGMVRDLHQLSHLASHEFAGLPLFMLGHSMGSFLTQNYIQLYGNELEGAIMTGSTGILAGVEQILPVLEAAAQGDTAAQPSDAFVQMFAGFNTPFVPAKTGFEWLSRDETEVQKYVDDPWSGFVFSNLLIVDMLKGMVAMWQPENEARIPQNLPILIASGDMDPVAGANAEGVKALFQRYQELGIKDVEMILYPHARHEILNEVNREEVHQAIIEWLAKHLPERA